MLDKINMMEIVKISIDAGDAILKVYESDFAIENKEDKSPLTEADKASNEVIVSNLEKLYTEIPIISEENKQLDYSERKDWDWCWLVDPLDGTKEFIKRNGEFTVNIALINKGVPVLGVIYVPVKDTLYFASSKIGSYKVEGAKKLINQGVDEAALKNQSAQLPIKDNNRNFTVVGSRSHMSPETEEYITELKAKHGEIDIFSIGSSLKLCMVAEGKADEYPRFAPTMEWDTAAGQAIVQEAGGEVLVANKDFHLSYNKEDLLNPWFLVRMKDAN